MSCAPGCGIPSAALPRPDRKSTRLNSSHDQISYAVSCLKKKKLIGIQGLLRFLNSIQNQRHLSELSRQTRAIDGYCWLFFVNDTSSTEIYTLSLHDALPT